MSIRTAADRKEFLLSIRMINENRNLVERAKQLKEQIPYQSAEGQKIDKILRFKEENGSVYDLVKGMFPVKFPAFTASGKPRQEAVSAVISRKSYLMRQIREERGKENLQNG